MPKYLTITEARQQMLGLPDELADEPVIITKRGKPVMVVLSYEHFASLVETLDILSDSGSDLSFSMRFIKPCLWRWSLTLASISKAKQVSSMRYSTGTSGSVTHLAVLWLLPS